VYYKDGSFDELKTWIEKESTEVVVPNRTNKEVAFVLFDPNRNIVKRVKFKRSDNELMSQLKMAANMIDRYDALLELKNTDVKTKRDALIAAFNKEDFMLIRTEIVAQLAEDIDPATVKMFRSAISDKDVNVRRAACSNLKTIPEELRKDYEALLNDSSYQIIASALENLVTNFTDRAASYLSQTAKLDGNSMHNIRVKWLELDYVKNNTPSSVIELRKFCDLGLYDNATVIPTMNAMKRLNYLDGPLTGLLFKAGKYWSGQVNAPARTVLEYFYEQSRYKKLIKEEYAKLNAEQKKDWKDLVK